MALQGSLVNRIMEAGKAPEITVGMGGTVCYYSDRSPVTVVAIRYAKDGKTVREIDTVADKTGPNKLVWPAQSYDIEPGWKEGDKLPEHVATWRMGKSHGRERFRSTYVNENGRRVMSDPGSGPGLALGDRDYYSDPSF